MTGVEVDLSLLESVRRIARRASEAILEIYADLDRTGAIDVQRKEDASPLTAADLAAHRIIVEELRALTPQVPILSEEAADVPFALRSTWDRLWLVDPLDGTKEFLSRNGEFTVNIALIEGGRPIVGCVTVPVTGEEYVGARGLGAFRGNSDAAALQPIHIAAQAHSPLRVLGSRSHGNPALQSFLDRIGPHTMLAIGSSLKFCRLAEGAADLYPRLGPTSEWDTAAGQAVLEAAGGRVVRLDGDALCYNRRAQLLNPHFVAMGSYDPSWIDQLRQIGVS